MSSGLFNSMSSLKAGLDAGWLRQEAILNNIVNVDTPGYNRQLVSFEEQYARALNQAPSVALKKTRVGHRDIGVAAKEATPSVYSDGITTTRMDGNNVDEAVETTELARNTLWYETLQRQLNSEYTQLRMAIREGG